MGAALRRSRVEQLEVYEPALALLWTLVRSEVPSAEARVTEAAVADGMPPSLAPLLGEASQEDALQRLRQLRGDELLHGHKLKILISLLITLVQVFDQIFYL